MVIRQRLRTREKADDVEQGPDPRRIKFVNKTLVLARHG